MSHLKKKEEGPPASTPSFPVPHELPLVFVWVLVLVPNSSIKRCTICRTTLCFSFCICGGCISSAPWRCLLHPPPPRTPSNAVSKAAAVTWFLFIPSFIAPHPRLPPAPPTALLAMELLPPEIARTHSSLMLPVVALHGMVELHDTIKAAMPQLQHISKAIDFKFPPNKAQHTLAEADVDCLLRWKTLRKFCEDIPSVQLLVFDCPPERSWSGAEPLIVSFIGNIREQRRKNCRLFVLLLDTNTSSASPLHSAFDEKVKSLRKHAELDDNQIAYLSISDLTPGNALVAGACLRPLLQPPFPHASFPLCSGVQAREGVVAALLLRPGQDAEEEAEHTPPRVQLPAAVQEGAGLRARQRPPSSHQVRQSLPAVYFCNVLRRYYDRTFKMLQDIPMTGRMTEHKTLASFITFKLCSLYVSCTAISNAKAQFRTFALAYADCVEHQIFKFQHFHFMAFQYKIFAQLLEHSLTPTFSNKRSASLPSSIAKIPPKDVQIGMASHVGFYYQHAASLLSKRRAAYLAACDSASMPPPPPPPPSSPTSSAAASPSK